MYVVHWYLWPVFLMLFLLCFLEVILYFIEVYFDISVFLTSLFVSDFFFYILPSDPSFCYTFLWELYSDIKYCSSLAQVVLNTYVVPRHWHDQWWPIVLSSDRAIITGCITIWKCRCSSVFHILPLLLSDCRYCLWTCKTSTVLMQNNLWYIMVISFRRFLGWCHESIYLNIQLF